MIALLIGSVGVFGATIHGAYDVAVLANPIPTTAKLPSQLDPRGFLTFALTGVALGLFGWLAMRIDRRQRLLGRCAIAGALLLLVVYFGWLIALDPSRNFIRVATLTAGLAVLPAFYLLLARVLLRPEQRGEARLLYGVEESEGDTSRQHPAFQDSLGR